ncbi:MAG: DUF2273 domain-containing protein [bacterium]|nr:DUF2273 domain-containing protein [bacterium]
MNSSLTERIKKIISKYPGRFAGVIIGLIIGLIIVIFGALKTSIIILCVVGGFFIGKSKER